MTTSQVSINPDQIRPTLEKIGYKLIDCGSHWRTRALYRGGDNDTAIRVYKNSGVWTDFAQGNQSFPFERLVKLTCGSDPKKIKDILSSLEQSEEFSYIQKQTIEMDTVYPESLLNNLFPNFSFYQKKNISEETLKFYKTGLAQSGKMYRRMVFPIYNEYSQIIGFSGRKIDDAKDSVPKWKHIGKKRNWIYPAYIPAEKTVDSIIKETGEVVIVESIGDSLALYESGIKNNLVSFGLGCQPIMLSYLSSFPVERIIIAGNNDSASDENHGYLGNVKTLINLLPYFDFSRIEIRIPPENHNDFFDAFNSGVDLKNWYNTAVDRSLFIKQLIDFVAKNKHKFQTKELNILRKVLKQNERT
jgi:hypothetical protein